jgi:hypothetical protein
MSTMDPDRSTMMALHELRAIEQRRIAEEAAAERARREAEARQAEARRAREQAKREARERAEREEHERSERERDELQAKAARVARLEGELEELSQRMAELQEGLRPASEPLMVPAAAPPSRRWIWGFAAVSWLGAFTLIGILWHVVQRPPVLPRLVPPIIDLGPAVAPSGTNKIGTTATVGPTTAPGDRAAGGSTDATKTPPGLRKEGTGRGSRPPRHPIKNDPLATGRNNTLGVTTKPSLEACSRSEDPLACTNLDDQPLGFTPRPPKPRAR